MFRKKIFAYILSLVLVFSFSATAFADGKTEIVRVDNETTEIYISHASLDNGLIRASIIVPLCTFIPNAGKIISAVSSVSGGLLKLNDHGNGVVLTITMFPKSPFPFSILESPQLKSISLRPQ